MKTAPAPAYVLALLLAVCFTLSTWLQPVAAAQKGRNDQSQSLLNVVMGDAQKLFAGLFLRKADVYFHSGYYPSIFDSARTNEMHIAEQAGLDTQKAPDEHGHEGHDHDAPNHEAHEQEEGEFIKPPLDWIEALGRYSLNTKHSHLDEMGRTGEMLPWLRMSAELDPQHVETYTVAAFWLRQMGKLSEAEVFLRDGLRANPKSSELQFELGRVYAGNKNDPHRALILYGLALDNWQKQEGVKEDPDYTVFNKILSHLALLEQKEGDYTNALIHMEMWKAKAPKPEAVQTQIDELKERMKPTPP